MVFYKALKRDPNAQGLVEGIVGSPNYKRGNAQGLEEGKWVTGK